MNLSYRSTRKVSENLCAPLKNEDYSVQPVADVSPPKWHLAHTTWFFEAFILQKFKSGYRVFDPAFAYLFNSYYETVGDHHPRTERGLLTRPTVEEVYRYRTHVDHAMEELLAEDSHPSRAEILSLATLGLHHEQQHQELLLMDIQYIFWKNPLRPVYAKAERLPAALNEPHSEKWIPILKSGQLVETGINPSDIDFTFDNETPRHKAYLEAFGVSDRLVTQGEYLEFIGAHAYERPELWLSDGWATVQKNQWRAPLYWEKQGGDWYRMSLHGMHKIAAHELALPVTHLSFYEADAYARWKNARLPLENEWEIAVKDFTPASGNFLESGNYSACVASSAAGGLLQPFGDAWSWTSSPYRPYPRYQPYEGSLGEYNGKFMSGQMVLRGGSYGTPQSHFRPTYRNFFPPEARWMFSGLRLARYL